MERVSKCYGRYRNFIENGLFPVLIMIYPLVGVNQGLNVADTTYSLANFQYFGQMKGTWMVATFLSNVAGSLLMRLPFGGTLLGMYFYTSLVQSVTALMVYLALRKRIPAPLLFVGEMLALGLCWCPSTVLYNYLTYFLMTAGMLLLYRGLTAVPGEASERLYFVAAGLCLGANVAVRMPNVVQAAFILAVWYGTVLMNRRQQGAVASRGDVVEPQTEIPWGRLAQVTSWCMLGYLLGFGIPLVAICVRYGFSAYPDMVRTMFAMTEQAADYKPTSMLTGMFGDYLRGMYWLVFAVLCLAPGILALLVKHKNKITDVIIKAIYCLLFLVLLRFYWGKGMFHFRYYEHGNGSVYYPTVLFLLITIFTAVLCLVRKKVRTEQKILAVLVLLEIFLTPLGSNNSLYPIINNLFLAAPFLLWTAADAVSDRFLWRAPVVLLTVFVLWQSIGLHKEFAFQDGIWGEPRSMKVETPEKAAGVYTNLENGTLIEELALYMQEESLSGRETIVYGELAGLHYLLDMPPALSTTWPDLDSYRMMEYWRDLSAVEEGIQAGEEPPVMILSADVAAYLSDDGEAINWFDVDIEAMAADEKLQMLSQMMWEYGYAESFGNARYVVYLASQK
ncbi:MAG: hypothetical protein HDR05_15710 [Lachnospiraceae bacterium]|nr:hypothetical protein [Lachnospiraceae bacterium]